MTSGERRKKSNRIHRPIVCCFYCVKHAILFLSLLLLLSPAGAQTGTNPAPTDQYPYAKFSPQMAIIIVILIAALFFMGFFSIYIRHCSETTPGGSVRARGPSLRRRAASRGLDPTVIETFPTFMYSEVKGLKIGKGALECAVCLNEFEDNETLRLLPKCDHVFHPECIDAWLESHVTCPVCRANLVPQPDETLQVPELNQTAETENEIHPPNEEVAIQVDEDREEPLSPQEMVRNPSVHQNRPPRSRSVRPRLFGKFPRSHSTGHSLVQPGENTDRFTLRLPDDVRKQVMSRTASFAAVLPRDSSSRRGNKLGIGEGSSRGGRSYRRLERLDRVVKSDRWLFSMAPPFFSRASSLRSPKVIAADGEGSTPKGAKTAVKLPSFKCLEPKSDEAGLVPADSVRPQV